MKLTKILLAVFMIFGALAIVSCNNEGGFEERGEEAMEQVEDTSEEAMEQVEDTSEEAMEETEEAFE